MSKGLFSLREQIGAVNSASLAISRGEKLKASDRDFICSRLVGARQSLDFLQNNERAIKRAADAVEHLKALSRVAPDGREKVAALSFLGEAP